MEEIVDKITINIDDLIHCIIYGISVEEHPKKLLNNMDSICGTISLKQWNKKTKAMAWIIWIFYIVMMDSTLECIEPKTMKYLGR